MNPRREILTTVYRCEKCEKAFSTENYLNSHIKRRHNEGNLIANEDDIIQSEIKELKERLNSTDKLLHQIHVLEAQPVANKSVDQNLFSDLEKKFVSFREQVDNEIATLHLEKNMYEEKYTKLFDLILQSKEKRNVAVENIGTMTDSCNSSLSRNELSGASPQLKIITIEGCTQTEDPKVYTLKQETVHHLSIVDGKNAIPAVSEEDRDKKIEEKLNVLNEDIENKISTSMDIIKNQMQTFWEEMKKENSNRNEDNQNKLLTLEDSTEAIKPEVKPRKKLQTPTITPRLSKEVIKSPVERSETSRVPFMNELIEVIGKQENEVASKISELQPRDIQYDSSSERDSLKTSSISQNEFVLPVQKSMTKPEIRTKTKPQDNVIAEINKIIEERLQGTSFLVDISESKFFKAMEILSRHSNLNKQIMKKPSGNKQKKNSIKNIKGAQKTASNKVVKICLKKSRQDNTISEPRTKPIIAIKNRSLFETDSDTDRDILQKKIISNKNDIANLQATLDQNSSVKKRVLFEAKSPLIKRNSSVLEVAVKNQNLEEINQATRKDESSSDFDI